MVGFWTLQKGKHNGGPCTQKTSEKEKNDLPARKAEAKPSDEVKTFTLKQWRKQPKVQRDRKGTELSRMIGSEVFGVCWSQEKLCAVSTPTQLCCIFSVRKEMHAQKIDFTWPKCCLLRDQDWRAKLQLWSSILNSKEKKRWDVTVYDLLRVAWFKYRVIGCS